MMTIKTQVRRVCMSLALAFSLAAFTGCGTSMGKYNITVSPSPSLKDAGGAIPSFEVDLVGVAETEADKWRKKPMGEYYSGRDQLRADADKHVLTFTTADPAPKTLKKDDPIWKVWTGKQATELFVLVNLPGVKDPLVLPLDRARWAEDTIMLEVQRSGLVPRTQMKPAK